MALSLLRLTSPTQDPPSRQVQRGRECERDGRVDQAIQTSGVQDPARYDSGARDSARSLQ